MAENLMDTTANTASKYQAIVAQYATDVGVKILAAIDFWVIGRWLIHLAVRLVQGSLEHQKVDPTVLRYVGSVITVTLNILLVIGILGYFGIQTTTFAALIAAAGVAIGMAWSGLLSNFAAGAFLIVLRPFKVGDFVTAGGMTGTVREIGLFATTFNTPDNVVTLVGNNKIFSDTIQNFTTNPYRRVELKAQLAGSADHRAAQGEGRRDPERAGGPAGRRGDPGVQPGRAGAGGTPAHTQRPLLAGLLRHQPHDPGSAGRSGLPGADTVAGAVGDHADAAARPGGGGAKPAGERELKRTAAPQNGPAGDCRAVLLGARANRPTRACAARAPTARPGRQLRG